MKTRKYEGMNIFQEARQRKRDNMGYRARRFKIVWSNKDIPWNFFATEWGIRWSDKWQLFPIWNMSDNCQRSLLFGFWKLYLQIIYTRTEAFNQNRKFFMRKRLWKFYQLVS